jgi:hypothetical protein
MRLRATAGLAAALLCSLAPADRLITTPRAVKLPDGTVRYLMSASLTGDRAVSHRVAAGFGAFFDAELRLGESRQGKAYTTGDVHYNVVAPISNLAPGISFGVTDVADRSAFGLQVYGVFTFREVLSTVTGDANGEVSIGYRSGSRKSAFFMNAFLPLVKPLSILVEHDGALLAGGLEYRNSRQFAVRWVLREDKSTVAFIVSRQF